MIKEQELIYALQWIIVNSYHRQINKSYFFACLQIRLVNSTFTPLIIVYIQIFICYNSLS
jgi:hypothetical protein